MSTLTYEMMREYLAILDKLPKIAVGIVCRPAMWAWCKLNLTACPPREAFGLGGIPLYVKWGQTEDYIEFYDHDALREYLKEEEPGSTPVCKTSKSPTATEPLKPSQPPPSTPAPASA